MKPLDHHSELQFEAIESSVLPALQGIPYILR